MTEILIDVSISDYKHDDSLFKHHSILNMLEAKAIEINKNEENELGGILFNQGAIFNEFEKIKGLIYNKKTNII